MRIFRFFTDWYYANKQKHIAKMKKQGKCPACRGYGFVVISSPYAGNSFECHLCNGTGLYTEWEKNIS